MTIRKSSWVCNLSILRQSETFNLLLLVKSVILIAFFQIKGRFNQYFQCNQSTTGPFTVYSCTVVLIPVITLRCGEMRRSWKLNYPYSAVPHLYIGIQFMSVFTSDLCCRRRQRGNRQKQTY